MIPVTDYRFGDKHYVTSFITPHNPDIEQVASSFGDIQKENTWVEKVAAFIRDTFEYPMANGMPLADGQLLRYTTGLFRHKWKACHYYVWAFPAEVLQSHLGYCAESANLACSLLIPKIPALVCLGEVRSSKDDSLLGLHAWIELPYKNEPYVFESTIHEKEANNLTPTKSVYNKDSEWAKRGVYYIAKAQYDNKEFTGDSSVIARMKLPAKRVLLFGLEKTLALSEKKLYKEWRAEDRIKEALLREIWQ